MESFLVESTKIGKVLKEKLISFGKAKDEELKSLKADMLSFKHDHEKKNLEKSIVIYTTKNVNIVIRANSILCKRK